MQRICLVMPRVTVGLYFLLVKLIDRLVVVKVYGYPCDRYAKASCFLLKMLYFTFFKIKKWLKMGFCSPAFTYTRSDTSCNFSTIWTFTDIIPDVSCNLLHNLEFRWHYTIFCANMSSHFYLTQQLSGDRHLNDFAKCEC